ncbi:MAG: hypothetical protein K9I35_02360 [Flavobacterium sp.]|jgi:hypothetical protein|nr:hypothetical protein [Flavobacterium sp.]
MKKVTSIFFLIILLNLFSCNASKETIYTSLPQEIKSITFENWTAGRMESGSGTVFVIELEKPLGNTIRLEKIYFKNLETEIVQVNETKFKANFHYNKIYQQHQTSAIATKEFHLKENEAVIEYLKNNKKYWYKCTQIKEITPLLFP